MESQEFFARTGNQNGDNRIEEILISNENNINNNDNYSDESEGTNNCTLRLRRINTP